MDEAAEILDGQRLLGTIEGVIEARRVCRMEIPNTEFAWITIILGMESIGDSHFLLIDKVREFETAMSHSTGKEISVDFMEADGVPCHFTTQVFESRADALWVELPRSILRMQKRKYYRVKARSGTEIVFHLGPGQKEKATVRDYSMGGIAFVMERHVKLEPGERVTRVELRIPQGSQSISFPIPFAIVKRIERQPGQKEVCVLEIADMSESTKEVLWRHIFEEQRTLLKRTKKS